ncbi:hypothetical protein SLS60_001432 [Paraconiothyrium brasiliense]|uniref:F-box domain-containing protein n=1 Tax=Paraconiothyrium brasiliense TaxID=300254 RepID=A0ABR3S974_9PLEO
MEDTQTAANRTTILDLPKEILLQVFGYFCDTFPAHEPQQYYKGREASDRLVLYNIRLVCRAFDTLVSPLLCPVVNVSLCSESIARLEGLCRNPLIAEGVRGVAISLRFRPSGIALDFKRYHAHAVKILNDCIGECDWHTEFQSYAEDDMSEDAVTHRDYEAAMEKFNFMKYAWGKLFEERSSQEEAPATTDGLEDAECTPEDETEDTEDDGIDQVEIEKEAEEARTLLKCCFETYSAAHADQARIVSDGSFVRSIVTALSHCDSSAYVWFNESQLEKENTRSRSIALAKSEEPLAHVMVQGHEWLKIEDSLCKNDDDTGLFFPASIMTDLPIACHDAAVKLRGIQVDCFPLLRGYSCLLPRFTQTDHSITQNSWARFAAACHDLEIFSFGQRGMNCSPIRPERQSASDSAIINGFIGAACSGPNLQRFVLSMGPFRVRGGRFGVRDEEHPYLASPILAALTSTHLRSIVLNSVDVCGQDLLALVKTISKAHLTDLYFASVTLSRGRYAEAMGLLHDIVVSRRQNKSSVPKITFSTLQGAEFGAPSTFDEGNTWIFGSKEERQMFWDRLEEHQRPALLQQVEEWVKSSQADELNPLLRFKVAQD